MGVTSLPTSAEAPRNALIGRTSGIFHCRTLGVWRSEIRILLSSPISQFFRYLKRTFRSPICRPMPLVVRFRFAIAIGRNDLERGRRSQICQIEACCSAFSRVLLEKSSDSGHQRNVRHSLKERGACQELGQISGQLVRQDLAIPLVQQILRTCQRRHHCKPDRVNSLTRSAKPE